MHQQNSPKIVADEFGNEYELLSCIGEGAEGAVYRTNREGKLIKLVRIAPEKREQWINHKRWLMRQRKEHFSSFIIPTSLIVGEQIGYVMNEVTNHIPLAAFIVKPANRDLHTWYNVETGGVQMRIKIAKGLAKCFRQLHINGFAFSDISPTNILVSNDGQSIWVIDPDNITAPSRFDATIIGTPRYIAPELFKESRSVSSITDTYAYGVLMFEMFRLGHPYIGDDLLEGTPEEEIKAFEGLYPYIDDPTIDSNFSSYHLPAQLILNDQINDLFMRLFVDGQKNFMRRPTLLEFYRAFSRVSDMVHQCSCGATYILQEKAVCPWCDEVASQLLFINCVQMSSVVDEGLATGKLNKSKQVTGQILLQEGKWVPIYQHHFNGDVLQQDNRLIGGIYKKGNLVAYVNRSTKRKTHYLLDGKTKKTDSIEYDARKELKPQQIIIIENFTSEQLKTIDVVEKIKLVNYIELSIEVNV